MKESNAFEDLPIAWTPSDEVIDKSQLKKFMKQVRVSSWDELYAKSIEDVEAFTAEVLKFLNIKFDPRYEKLLDTSEGIEWSKWCVGAGLNITEMCLDRWQDTEIENNAAIIWEGEDGKVETYTYKQLKEYVAACAGGLSAAGFTKGDAIVIHLPMIAETVVSLLAINRIGAIAVPVFSGYGVEAIASRMNAVGAKGLITSAGFSRRGKFINAFKVAEEAAQKCGTIEKVFVCSCDPDGFLPNLTSNEIYSEFNTLFADSNPKDFLAKTSANDPAIILYSSGTTGRPKGIAHVHCGFPIKAAQDMAFGTDVGRGTRISWVTDIGWMMGPWLIYWALINGATMVLYDGSPDYPNPDRMWEFSAKHKVEILGISPTLIRVLSTKGDDLPKKHDLSSLRAFASTGEPWNPAPWYWLFEKVGGGKLPIINYSGGTEISGGILMGNPLLPQKPGSFPAPCPGMAADILNETGESAENGEVGELAIRKPWIGMARGFWEENERYLETYWSRFEKIWVHGDFAMRDKDEHWYILGRSDDTLNIAGKRVGPAEIESLLVADERVAEAAVIGVPDEIKGTAMVAFCVLTDEGSAGILPAMSAAREQTSTNSEDDKRFSTSDDADADRTSAPPVSLQLEKELKAVIARDMGKPLTPKRIHFVSALSKTRNGKVMRRVIRSAYLGEDVGDVSALENPQTVQEIGDINL